MKTEKKFFVYVDYRGDDGRPFYVGKGVGYRVKKTNRNSLHTKIKNKHGMVRKVVFETYSEQEAFQKEIELIQELKTYFHLGEGGANFTLGGEGGSGRKYTDEQRKKTWENPEIRKKYIESRKRKWEDPEYRKKMREARKKKWEEPEYRKKMSERNKKRGRILNTGKKEMNLTEKPVKILSIRNLEVSYAKSFGKILSIEKKSVKQERIQERILSIEKR